MEWTWPSSNTTWKSKRRRIQGHLTRCILSMVEDQFGDDSSLRQHDNAPCHKARSVDNKILEMDWPSQSPDLNPTEYLWDESEHRLRSRSQRPTSLTALVTDLQAAIPPETFRHLVEILPGRGRAVIKPKGRPTLYLCPQL
jgi:hypothetical protein